jgi:hypothetical protein
MSSSFMKLEDSISLMMALRRIYGGFSGNCLSILLKEMRVDDFMF